MFGHKHANYKSSDEDNAERALKREWMTRSRYVEIGQLKFGSLNPLVTPERKI